MNTKLKKDEVIIRPAGREDMVAVYRMIKELYEFEKMPDGPKYTVAELERDGFDSPPQFRCLVAELLDSALVAAGGCGNDTLVGYALYFPMYSTYAGRSYLLEDLYVSPVVRGKGVGDKLFNAVALEAKETNSSRIDFIVLGWNPALEFYKRKGAVNVTETESWCLHRLAGEELERCADQAIKAP